jgi:hypothetical protein
VEGRFSEKIMLKQQSKARSHRALGASLRFGKTADSAGTRHYIRMVRRACGAANKKPGRCRPGFLKLAVQAFRRRA